MFHVKTGWLKPGAAACFPPLMLFLAGWLIFFAAAGRGAGIQRMAEWLRDGTELVSGFWLLFRLADWLGSRFQQHAKSAVRKWDLVLVSIAATAVRRLLPVAAVVAAVPAIPFPPGVQLIAKDLTTLLLIGACGYVVYELINAVEDTLLSQIRLDVPDNVRARKLYTQIKVFKKICIAIVVVFTLASMLMVFDSVRHFGTSILASAGVAGVIIGFAAQKSLGLVLAGFQIAITQPIRLDDVVIVENEWGWVEEITLTYVVVRIWDQRRLVLPINYFIEKPFQNWTLVTSELLGTVFLYLDYRVPLDAIRTETDRILDASVHWDRRAKAVEVTDTKNNVMEVRILASARDSSTSWNLRCELRERLIVFLQKQYPDSLPRMRAEVVSTTRQ